MRHGHVVPKTQSIDQTDDKQTWAWRRGGDKRWCDSQSEKLRGPSLPADPNTVIRAMYVHLSITSLHIAFVSILALPRSWHTIRHSYYRVVLDRRGLCGLRKCLCLGQDNSHISIGRVRWY